ncbi:hypothetical protein SAMN05421738_1122 [Algoriella xinjiangensis]|uniref:Helix-turn-helix domain-containing protein n=1 Tax=Algoriella xinjiangensis TaxID=684065 RepID=A0A1I4YVB2_9FLAO|nr:helix-turn-helix domain-containing protein [Algoriella xinjiangensis]SFN41599.1 hypothetical protein SAMN05421738_1122 [Algoriella xinjiangensis]
MSEVKLLQELHEMKTLIKQNYINEKPILTSKELELYLNFSESTIAKLAASKLIPFSKPTNGARFFIKQKIHEWIEMHSISCEDDAEKLYQSYNKKRKSR